MDVAFVAGFGPVVEDVELALTFWRDQLGLPLDEIAPGYHGTDDLDGVKAFAAWPLAQAARSAFGVDTWPAALPRPQAWIELDVASPAAVHAAVEELRDRGHELLRGAAEEPWGQTTSRLLSPEGLLVGITHTPWLHDDAGGDPASVSHDGRDHD